MKINVTNLLQYRESEYFNADEYYLMYVPNLKRFWITKAVNYNGAWYGGNYKLTSVMTCIESDLKGLDVRIENSHGKIVKMMDDVDSCVGVIWAQGTKELPSFWNPVKNLVEVK